MLQEETSYIQEIQPEGREASAPSIHQEQHQTSYPSQTQDMQDIQPEERGSSEQVIHQEHLEESQQSPMNINAYCSRQDIGINMQQDQIIVKKNNPQYQNQQQPEPD